MSRGHSSREEARTSATTRERDAARRGVRGESESC
jgi:hypothetical protein